jgi:hypothetical protein
MNSTLFRKCVLGPLAELCYPEGKKSDERRVMVHFDNVQIHNTEGIQEYLVNVPFRGMKHPLYHPDLILGDFFLFETITENVSGHRFDSPDNLFVTVENSVSSLSEDFVQTVFQEWMRRFLVCCESGGE